MLMQPQQIIDKAIQDWQPVAVICAYSGGYDSLVTTHLAHTALDLHTPSGASEGRGLPLSVWSIDTKLSADGWVEYVRDIGKRYGWQHTVHDNQAGFNQFVKLVIKTGCPYSREGHEATFNRLKGRSFDELLRRYKGKWRDKVLVLSGIRQSESAQRQKLTEPVQRRGESNLIFANPIFYWSEEQLTRYRTLHNLPENPFYNTVGGSGDCQCNWGNFITLDALKRYSPNLAAGNVKTLDEISKRLHGYGWDGEARDQGKLFDKDTLDYGELTTPFLCSNCSRSKRTDRAQAAEFVALQRGLF